MSLERRRDHSLGNHLAELGAYIDCARKREGKLRKDLKNLLGNIPYHFMISGPLEWVEKPAPASADPDLACSNRYPGARLNNFLTLSATVYRQAPTPCDSSSSSTYSSSSSSLKAKAKPKSATAKPKSKSVKKSSPSAPSGTAKLYKKFGLESKVVSPSAKKLKAPALSCASCPDSSSVESESCDESCVKACVDCPSDLFPRLIPYAIEFNLQFTRLRGVLQNNNSLLEHTLDGQIINEIEAKIRAAGIHVRGRFLDALPTIQTAVLNGYGNNGEVMNLIATINWKKRKVYLGRNQITTVSTVPRQLFGRAPQPVYPRPTYTTLGLGRRSQFLSNFFNINFVVDLSLLSDIRRIASSERNGGGGDNSEVCSESESTDSESS